MSENIEIIGPVIALVVWSMVMWVWMYATRIPAMIAAEVRLDPNAPSGELVSKLPANVRWKADNYNHLMEQPTIFYALALSLALLGEGSGFNLYVAWAYVLLRIIHSLVHVLGNNIKLRFFVFVFSNIPILILLYNSIVTISN